MSFKNPINEENLIVMMILCFNADAEEEIVVETFTKKDKDKADQKLAECLKHAQPPEFFRLVNVT